MAQPQFTLQKKEIMLLFNRLMQSGYDRNLQISVPLLEGMPLFKLHFNAKTVCLADFLRLGCVCKKIFRNYKQAEWKGERRDSSF